MVTRRCRPLAGLPALLAVLCGCNGAGREATSFDDASIGGTQGDDTGAADTSSTGANGSDGADETGAGCAEDHECPFGTTCQAGACMPGCNAEQPCPDGLACCGTCVDLATDVQHCGACDEACPVPEAAEAICVDGECGASECAPGFADCNGDASDGCETAGDCECEPGTMQACYSADPATMGVGACASGTQICNEFGAAWLPCEGEVGPTDEVCANAIDDDCDGTTDEDLDLDGDGFTACGGDCCDEQGPNCSNPELVNPGAFEVAGNTVDDDCDGAADNPLPACDAGLPSNSAVATEYALAIDLCRFTDEFPADPADATWGVVDGGLFLANSLGAPAAQSRSIRDGFGDNIDNRFGDRLAVLSTGRAADDAGDVNPGFLPFQEGQSMGTSSAFPGDWYAANGNDLPNAPDCPAPIDSSALNPVNLQLRVRVPTNANSFSVDMFFFSAEYPEYVCTEFNDFFVTLVDSTDPNNPADGNIAIYDDGADTWPVGVNILSAASGLFTACTDGTISQCGDPATYNGCTSDTELLGTGFDIDGEVTYACDYGGQAGGGTGWLTMSGNVTPGEIMTIRFIVWDTSDQLFDSLVLLDHWTWSVQASEPGVKPA